MDGLLDFVTNLINKEGLVSGIVGTVLVLLVVNAKPVIQSWLKRGDSEHDSDIETNNKIVDQYLGRRAKDEKYFDDYVQTFKGRIGTLETSLEAAESRYRKAEAKHETETKVMRGEIDSLKTLREKDAAKARQQSATIKEQAADNKTYREAYKRLEKEVIILTAWKVKVESALGPWLAVVVEGLTPGNIEKLNGTMDEFVKGIKNNDN